MAPLTFALPDALSASGPPEQRGVARDHVRLLVAAPGRIEHARFHQIGRFLTAGDLLVINTSATLAAAVDGIRLGGRPTVVHMSAPLDTGRWVIELREPDRSGPQLDGLAGETVTLAGGATLKLLAPYHSAGRLWEATVDRDVVSLLNTYGRPIRYSYSHHDAPLSAYQTVFATVSGREPGSAEMPSAGRPFSTRVVCDLITSGIAVAPITLHTGVSSLESHEPPQPERFDVPEATARLINATRAGGGRIVAVGTTVARAIETVAEPDGFVHAGSGWTDLMLSPERPARTVGGIVTGWHAPEASHLLLLEAVAGTDLVAAAYDEALREEYLWHEFGDSCLLLPPKAA